MTSDFDPEFDKLPDQPVTIGGDKSAAAWHPGNGPEVPHEPVYYSYEQRQLAEARAERDALQRGVVAATERAESAEAERDPLAHVIEQARILVETMSNNGFVPLESWWRKRILNVLDNAPAASLALHDAEVKAQALDEAAAAVAGQRDDTAGDRVPEDGLAYTAHRDGRFLGKTVAVRLLRARAAAILEEAK